MPEPHLRCTDNPIPVRPAYSADTPRAKAQKYRSSPYCLDCHTDRTRSRCVPKHVVCPFGHKQCGSSAPRIILRCHTHFPGTQAYLRKAFPPLGRIPPDYQLPQKSCTPKTPQVPQPPAHTPHFCFAETYHCGPHLPSPSKPNEKTHHSCHPVPLQLPATV